MSWASKAVFLRVRVDAEQYEAVEQVEDLIDVQGDATHEHEEDSAGS